MVGSSPPRHEIARPHAQLYNPAAANTPLAALFSALSSVAQTSNAQPSPIGQGSNDAQFTAQLCSALNLRPDSLFSNFQRGQSSQSPFGVGPAAGQTAQNQTSLPNALLRTEDGAAEHSSAVACTNFGNSSRQELEDLNEQEEDQATNDTSSNTEQPSTSLQRSRGEPMSEDAKKKRRQEINRESARRVRKRKSMEHQQLQQKVAGLQSAAASSAADQAVIVRYASELTRERDALLQRAVELEQKWLAAECRNIVLRQRIAEIKDVPLHEISADTGQVTKQTAAADKPV